MGKIIGIITARMISSRLPGKVMKKICGKSIFALHVERMKSVNDLAGIYLATSKNKRNGPLIRECKKLKVKYYQGSEEDVLERHISILIKERADAALRVTCDMPLFDIDSASRLVKIFKKKYYDYVFVKNMTMVQGTIPELISQKAMTDIHQNYKGPAITQPIKENMKKYKTKGIEIDSQLCRPEYRLTLDYPQDLKLMDFIYKKLYKAKAISLFDVYKLLDDNPDVVKINTHVQVKGVVKYSDAFLYVPEFSIAHSGNMLVFLDSNKSRISLEKFRDKINTLLSKTPETKRLKII